MAPEQDLSKYLGTHERLDISTPQSLLRKNAKREHVSGNECEGLNGEMQSEQLGISIL